MAPVKNARVIFNEPPKGLPVPGTTTVYDESQTIDLENAPIDGGILLKILVLSIDPFILAKLRDPSIKAPIPAFTLGESIENYGVGVVLRSENPNVKVGNHLYGMYPFQQYLIAKDTSPFLVLQDEGIPWSVYVGTCGMPGQTAHHGWKEYARPKKGDIAFVTAAAGAVGSVVVQFAKADGMKVIASAGSDEKVEFLKSIGADVAFNYKKEKTAEVLAKEGPINIYWDNVGGESLEAALGAAAWGAQFIECGMISDYGHRENPYYVKNLFAIISKQLQVNGFTVNTLMKKYRDVFYRDLPALVKSGKFKYGEDVSKGLEHAGHAIVDVLTGKNTGKKIVVVADE